MFFEVLSPTYHSPITIELLTYGVLLRTLGYPNVCLGGCSVAPPGGEVGASVRAEVHGLREVLTKQPIGVLVAAPLPRAMRVAEVVRPPAPHTASIVQRASQSATSRLSA